MFKTKEDIKKEVEDNAWNAEYTVELVFSSIAERVEFYEKYKDHPNWLYDQQLCIYVQYQKEVETIIEECRPKYDLKYRDWLFHFCFDGVTQEVIV